MKCHYQNCQSHFFSLLEQLLMFGGSDIMRLCWIKLCLAFEDSGKLSGFRDSANVLSSLLICQSCDLWTSLCHPMPGVMSKGLGRQRDAQMSWKHHLFQFSPHIIFGLKIKVSRSSCGVLQNTQQCRFWCYLHNLQKDHPQIQRYTSTEHSENWLFQAIF